MLSQMPAPRRTSASRSTARRTSPGARRVAPAPRRASWKGWGLAGLALISAALVLGGCRGPERQDESPRVPGASQSARTAPAAGSAGTSRAPSTPAGPGRRAPGAEAQTPGATPAPKGEPAPRRAPEQAPERAPAPSTGASEPPVSQPSPGGSSAGGSLATPVPALPACPAGEVRPAAGAACEPEVLAPTDLPEQALPPGADDYAPGRE